MSRLTRDGTAEPPDNRSSQLSITSSRPFSSNSLAWHFEPATAEEEAIDHYAIDHYTYGVHSSPVPLLKGFGSRTIYPQKNAAASSSPNVNLPTKQRVPRSQKGQARRRPRTAWIEYQVLPRYFLYNPPSGGGSELVQLETAAVVQRVWCQSPQMFLFGQVEPKNWPV